MGRSLFSSNQDKACVGVECADQQVRWVEMERDRQGQVVVKAVEAERLPVGAVVKGRIEQKQAVIEVIRRLKERSRLRKPRVHLVLPGAEVVARVHAFADVQPSQLMNRLRHELQHVKPVPFPDPVVDYIPLVSYGVTESSTESPNEGSIEERTVDKTVQGQQSYMVIVAPKKLVAQHQEVCKAVQLVPISVEIRPLAIFRFIESQWSEEASGVILVVDFQGTSVELSLFVQGEFHITRYITLTTTDASEEKDRRVEALTRQLSAYIQQFTNYYRYTLGHRHVVVRKLFWSGELERGEQDAVGEQLCVLLGLSALAFVKPAFGLQTVSVEQSHHYAVAFGLALRGGE